MVRSLYDIYLGIFIADRKIMRNVWWLAEQQEVNLGLHMCLWLTTTVSALSSPWRIVQKVTDESSMHKGFPRWPSR